VRAQRTRPSASVITWIGNVAPESRPKLVTHVPSDSGSATRTVSGASGCEARNAATASSLASAETKTSSTSARSPRIRSAHSTSIGISSTHGLHHVAQTFTQRGRVGAPGALPVASAGKVKVGASFADMPAPMLSALLTDVAADMGEKPDCPALRLTTPDGAVWQVGEQDGAVTITGPAHELAAWLLGRSKGRELRSSAGRKLPELPRWL